MTETEQVLKVMTPKQAKVWGLVLDGYKQHEIAESLEISQAAVSRLVDRGRRRAKKYSILEKK